MAKNEMKCKPKAGAMDYGTKEHLARIRPAVIGVVGKSKINPISFVNHEIISKKILFMRILCCLCLVGVFSTPLKANESFQITSKIGGFVQIRYHDYQDESSTSTFKVKRTHLRWFGNIGQDWIYFVQVDASDLNKNHFRDGIIKWMKYDFINITVGQSFIPYSIVNEIPTYKIYLLDPPIPYLNLSNTRDIGIRLDGKVVSQTINYAVGIYNGSSINKLDTNRSKDLIGKISIYPFKRLHKYTEKFRIMTGYHGSNYLFRDKSQAKKKRYNFASDFQYEHIRFFGEYFSESEGNINSSGWYITGAYKILDGKHCSFPPALETALRYEYFDPNNDIAGDWQNAITLGLNIFVNDYIKLQGNYKFKREGKEEANDEFIMQLQVKFGIK